MSKLVTIAKLSSPEEAISVRSLLESAGITVFGSNRNFAYVQNLSGIPIIVLEDDADAARQIIVDAVDTAAVPADEFKGRRLSERAKPAVHIAGGFVLGIWVLPLMIISAVVAWFTSPGRRYTPPDDTENAP